MNGDMYSKFNFGTGERRGGMSHWRKQENITTPPTSATL